MKLRKMYVIADEDFPGEEVNWYRTFRLTREEAEPFTYNMHQVQEVYVLTWEELEAYTATAFVAGAEKFRESLIDLWTRERDNLRGVEHAGLAFYELLEKIEKLGKEEVSD